MKKRILPILCLLLTLAALLQVGVCAAPVDNSLTLCYQKEGTVFPDLQVAIYQVAELQNDGSYQLLAPFDAASVNLDGITEQSQWQSITQTVFSCIVANGVAPSQMARTDEAGLARFSNLPEGLFYVQEVVADNANGTYIFNQFMIYLPTPNPDGSFNYVVEAKPKCLEFIPKTQYTVTKLWQDGGNSLNRPKEVIVDIYHQGVLQETQVLSAQNNWTYTWTVTQDNQSGWTVAEREVPEHYKVTVRQNDNTFTLINTRQGKPNPPKTGDTFNPMPLVVIMCISGALLVVLGLYGRRRFA
jgi:LPXTG-motif cell wall-anchored protein